MTTIGEFPWRDDPAGGNQGLGAANGSAPAQKHFARRARAAAARVARTTEETGYLRDQLVRTLAFYPARKSLLEERIAELEGPQQQQQQQGEQRGEQQGEQQPCDGLHGECGPVSGLAGMQQAGCGSGTCTKQSGQVAILRRALARFTVMEGIARHVLRREIVQLTK